MKSLLVAFTLLGALVASRAAHADTAFDSTGWTKLGEQAVDGRRDTDTFTVGRTEGRFTKLAIVVLDDDAEVTGMTVRFGNGKTFTPELRHQFAEGSRSRAIDLPGDTRGIASVQLTYGKLGRDHRRDRRGGVKARVQVWGMEAAADAPETPFDATGWTLVGSKRITSKRGSLTLKVSKRDQKLDRLTLVTSDSDLRITNVQVTYTRGKKGVHKVDRDLRRGDRSAAVDLAAQGRAIKSVTISYANRTGGKFAMLKVYGQAAAPAVDTTGWTLLGEQTVDGRRDRDTLQVGRDDGRFSRLMVVVLDGDVDMDGITIHTRKDDIKPDLRQTFREGSRSRELDLPGRRAVIKSIDLAYGKTRGGGKARVQIWAR